MPRFERPGWRERHEQYAARAAAGPIDLLFLGDSITQRWDQAPAVWQRYYGHRRAVAMGIDNDGTQQLLWRLAHSNLDRVAPRAAVLLIGINNIGNDLATAADVVAGTTAAIELLAELCPTTTVLLLGILPYGRPLPGRGQETIGETNRRFAALADGKRLHFLDVGPVFLGPDGQVDRALLHDGAHPSPRGYEVLAAAIEPTLRRLLDEQEPP